MDTNKRVGNSLGLFATGVFTLFSAAALAMPAPALASAAMPTTQPSRTAATRWHFQDIPVRSALKLLAEEGDFNLVVSDAVTGNVTLHLENVTWEQVLALVLRMNGLEQRIVGDTRSVDVDR